MATLELHDQRIHWRSHSLPVHKANVVVNWPDDCTVFDLKRPDISAQVTATVEVPRHSNTLRAGNVWRMPVVRHAREFFFDLLPFKCDRLEPFGKFNWLAHWQFLIVGFKTDPLALFPRTRVFRAAGRMTPPVIEEMPDMLAQMKAFLLEELPDTQVAKFNAEGGFTNQ